MTRCPQLRASDRNFLCINVLTREYCTTVLNILDNEIDGETMVGLTEQMIANLLPTIRSQVLFMKMRAELVAMCHQLKNLRLLLILFQLKG